MKIDENTINHNALLIIEKNITTYTYESAGKEDDILRAMNLAYINGVVEFADALKEFLKL